MFEAGLTVESLRDCLAGLPPVELKGMALLRGAKHLQCHSSGQFFPQFEIGQQRVPREVIAEAVTEIVGYTDRCRRAAEQLTTLTPIPLTAFSILEYGL
jgi:hypothetical protein